MNAVSNRYVMYETYYDILQVSPSAERAVIQQAWRVLASRYHPDRNPSPDAEAHLVRLNRARDVLLDPLRRIEYDRLLASQGMVSGTTAHDRDPRRRHSDFHLSPRPARRASDADRRNVDTERLTGRRTRDR